MTPALRRMISRGAAAEEFHAAAVAGGMVDLKAYAVRLLVQGLRSTDEVTSVVSMGTRRGGSPRRVLHRKGLRPQ